MISIFIFVNMFKRDVNICLYTKFFIRVFLVVLFRIFKGVDSFLLSVGEWAGECGGFSYIVEY